MDLSTELDVRFADLDAYGHVNHATFFTYLETARTRLFKRPFLELMQEGLLLMIVGAECRYLSPVDLNCRVVVSMQLEQLKRARFTLGYRVHNGEGLIFAEAKTEMICYDKHRSRPVEIPESMVQAMRQS